MTCRLCSGELEKMIDLGMLPLANDLREDRKSAMEAPKYPLVVSICRSCGLAQLPDSPPPSSMFDQYLYQTGASKPMVEHFDRYAREMIDALSLSDKSLVLDIGSNDGTLLKSFKRRGVNVAGVEPARNLALKACDEGIFTYNSYFSRDLFSPKSFSLVTANNVISHVPDPGKLIDDVSFVLERGGAFAFEIPWILDVVRNNAFDMIYHEHLSYFGFNALKERMEKAGLYLSRLEYFPDIHGGSLRGLASKDEAPMDTSLLDMEMRESGPKELVEFAGRIPEIAPSLKDLVSDLDGDGCRIAGYGAPAKATIMLNYCGLDQSLIPYVTDSTPLKQGRYIPGVGIGIMPPHPDLRPDYFLLFAWNYQKEIIEKEKAFIDQGGRFIIPLPEPHIYP